MDGQLLLRLADVARLFNVPERTLRRLRSRGQFPAPTQFLGRYPAWNRDTIERFARGEWKPAKGARRHRATATA